MKHLGHTSAYMAELWGLYQGLCLAKNQGVLKLEVQIDSAVIVRREGSTTGWPFIKKRKLRPSFFADWDVKIIHVYQLIYNWCIHVLANMGCVANMGKLVSLIL